jgi:eukaryotic-like serine/threonine-protein kinase
MLIPCPGCGKRVSDRAPRCPFCSRALAGVAEVSSVPAPAVPASGTHDTPAAATSPPAPDPVAALPASATLDPEAPPEAPPAARPATAPRYKRGHAIGEAFRVLDVIGEGGFGVVYLVHNQSTGASHVLKTIRDEWLRDATARDLFRKAAQIWISVGRHPYLVHALFVEEIHGRLYLGMEYIAPDQRGINSLESQLQRQPPSLGDALRWAVQFCHGMEYAYSRGVRCHHDVKPANILIGPDRAVRITDFGIAGAAAPGTVAAPTHMSPEQFVDAAGCDERSDVYSFGVVLYQMAAGGSLPFSPPVGAFPGAGSRLFAEMRRLHEEAAPPGLDSPLGEVVARCLEKDRAARYPGFRELREDLEPLLLRETGKTLVPPGPEEMQAFDLCNKGLTLVSLGQAEEGLACYERALVLVPSEPVVHNNKGSALFRLGRQAEALASFAEAIRLDPRYDGAWINRGLSLARTGRSAEALQAFDQAVAVNGRNPGGWAGRGAVLGRLGRRQEALAAYGQALAIDPGDPLAWSSKGGDLLELGQNEEALAAFDQALATDPRFVDAWIGRATALGHVQRHAEAVASFDEALRLDPRNARAFYNKGNSLVQLQQWGDALACFEVATQLAPTFPVAWYNRALCELVFARAQDALSSFRRFLERAETTDELRPQAEWLVRGIESGELEELKMGGAPPQMESLPPTEPEGTGERRPAEPEAAPASVREVPSPPPAPPPLPAPPPPAPPTGPSAEEASEPERTSAHGPPPPPVATPSTDEPASVVAARLRRGEDALDAGRFDEALVAFDEALAADPEHRSALNGKGLALRKLKRYDEAVAAFDRGLASEPKDLLLLANKGECLEEAGRTADAAAVLQRYLLLAPAAEGGVARIRAKVQALARQRATPVAPTAGSSHTPPAGVPAAVAPAGSEAAPSSPPSATDALKKGLLCQNQGEMERALDWFDLCLAAEPANVVALAGKGECFRALGRWAEAVASFDQALSANPSHSPTWLKRGLSLEGLGRHGESLASFEKAIEHDPKNPLGWNSRGLALGHLGRHDEALDSFNKALSLEPRSPLPRFHKAELEDRMGRADDAAISYQQFLAVASPAVLGAQVQQARQRLAELRGSKR